MDKYKKRLTVMSKLEKILVIVIIGLLIVWLISSNSYQQKIDTKVAELETVSQQVTELEATNAEQTAVINKLKNPDVTKSITIPATKDKYEKVADGKDVTLGYGTFEVGEDIEPGTYSITPLAGYDNMFVRGLFGGTSYSHTFGFNQFDEGAARTVQNVELVSGEMIEIDDVEVSFEANTSKELVSSGAPESVETMTRTYDDSGAVTYLCTKDDESTECSELENYDKLKTEVDSSVKS